jgi:hypothetical protein
VIRYPCPTCEETVESSDEVAGLPILCPHCRSPLTVPRASQPTRPHPPPRERVWPQRSEEVPFSRTGRCDLCRDLAVPVRSCCVRVSKSYREGRFRHEVWINARCESCAICYRAGRRAAWFPYVFAGVLGVLLLGLLAFVVQMGENWQLEGIRNPRETVLYGGIAVILLGGVPLGLLITAILRRVFWARLAPETNRQLLSLLDLTDWGLGRHAVLLPAVPYDEKSTQL